MRAGEHERLALTLAVGSRIVPIGAAPASAVPDRDAVSALWDEALVLKQLGIGKPLIARMAQRALRNRTTIERELLHGGGVREDAYYAGMARLAGLPFVEAIEDGQVTDIRGLDSQLQRPTQIRLNHGHKPPVTVIVPEARRFADLTATLARLPDLRTSLAIAAPSTVRQAVWRAGARRRSHAAVNGLFEADPRFSARVVLAGRQGFWIGSLLTAFLASLLLETDATLLVLHIVLTLIFFLSLMPRLTAVVQSRRSRPSAMPALLPGQALPVYSVMVALYQETEVVSQLLTSLDRLNWPKSRLDIKLVCEEDDLGTIAAIKALEPGPQFEIVEVPACGPRTKPKALTYALAGVRGDYVAIFDAEDRPHPDQLLEAYQHFSCTPDDIACLQAPLIIANAKASCISALFSLEYSALFRGLLPFLARHSMPLPLGGTSNHFRTHLLRAAGGWDPYNVTEDADIGLRLYRLGYRAEVIRRQTLEDAPTSIPVWTGQRTRWFKGWLQTWLVVMRSPSLAIAEMGPCAFVVFQLLIGGMLLSSLAHPVMILFLTQSTLAMMRSPGTAMSVLDKVLFYTDMINVLGSYATFLALGATKMTRFETRLVSWRWIFIPVYWLMMSMAAWRAVFELRSRPFFWNKTPHRPTAARPEKEAVNGTAPRP
ncbi:glycosyltransferase [Agrobacterium sp. a22-2]|uniref:glycosyltransferase family 2 protein n=1 Tax=Agrobacterium sp. a22-2 TaxID=2283840 RepID=UPI00144601BE|nr:glycosyltransferase family 2 protein [Agrobacterium sp. a22-2]NKN34955.1 glycosyltransferase [Agrobacterium sp. a22-2]